MRTSLLFALLLAVLLVAPTAAQSVEFLGLVAVPGGGNKAAKDFSALPHSLLEDGVSYQDSFDGFGSAIAYTGSGNRYLLLSDRGPNKVQYAGGDAVDFTTSYANRFQVADIVVSKVDGRYQVKLTNVGTVLLKDAQGRQFTGISTAFIGSDASVNLRRDPEGIRVAKDGSVWICDEYGPVIDHFNGSGARIGGLAVPESFNIAHLAATLKEEMQTNTSGRYTNRGLEGLAITPSGRYLVAALQSALIQDGGLKGKDTRILVYDLTRPDAPPRQFAYPLDSDKTAISEILAVNDTQFLVDERDGTPGAKGIKLLYRIDLGPSAAPTDIAKLDALAKDGNTTGVVPLTKTLFADIGAILNAANPWVSPAGLPDKIEGYAFGPDLPDGRHLLLATNDNDYSTTFPDYVFAFAVAPDALPGFQAFHLSPGVSFGP